MSMLEEIRARYTEGEEILSVDGFDDAVIGVMTDFTVPRLVYSVTRCLEILEEEFKKDEDCDDPATDAMEHFTFNISGADVGENTPVYCWDQF